MLAGLYGDPVWILYVARSLAPVDRSGDEDADAVLLDPFS